MKEESGKLRRGKTDLYFFFYFCTEVTKYIKGFAHISRFKEETIKRQKNPTQTKTNTKACARVHLHPTPRGLPAGDARTEPRPVPLPDRTNPWIHGCGPGGGQGAAPARPQAPPPPFRGALPPPSCERGAVPDPCDEGSWHCPGQGEPRGARPGEPEGTQTEPLPQGAGAAVTHGCCFTVPAWV